jgi:hypothetical protein
MLTSGDLYRVGSSIEVEKQRGQFPEASMRDKFGSRPADAQLSVGDLVTFLREPLPETRPSGSMSGNRKQRHAKLD